MITVIITAEHAYTWRDFLRTLGRDLADEIRVVSYGTAMEVGAFPSGSVVFTDIDRLVLLQRMAAERLHDQLLHSRPDIRLLNSPRDSLCRYELLSMLHKRGVNRFGVYRADEDWRKARLPVFVRIADDHSAPRTTLLTTHEDVEAEIRHLCGWKKWKKETKKAASVPTRVEAEPLQPLQAEKRDNSPSAYLSRVRWRWHFKHDVIISEFSATADSERLYHKYGAFVVGNRIVPAHLWFSEHWVVKFSSSRQEPKYLEKELEYLRTNPHAEQLLEICDLAGIQFGRLDYSVGPDGALQLWEINTNPHILPTIDDPLLAAKRAPTHDLFVTGFSSALRALQPPARAGAESPLKVAIEPA